jgi:hypothetical protein
MTAMTVKDYLTRIQSDSTEALALLNGNSDFVLVRAGDNLQAALDQGGNLQLEDGATFEGNFVIKSGTNLLGTKATIHGKAGGPPALYVPPRERGIAIEVGTMTSAGDQAVLQIGTSDSTQTTLDDVPADITVTGTTIPTFRGKRGFYINGKNVLLKQCVARDVWDPAGRDSQGILIFNTPGPVTVSGGLFEAGSENIMVGGDVTAIHDVQPADLLFEDVTLSRPLGWKTDGIKRKVKNLFELKAGVRVALRRAVLSGCWTDAQTGWAIMLTPRNGKAITDVMMENITIRDAGGGINLLGYDNTEFGPQARNFSFLGFDAICQGGDFGAGRFAQWEAAPDNIVIQNCVYSGPGTTIYANEGKVWTDPTHSTTSGISHGVHVLTNDMTLNDYAIMLLGNAYARNWKAAWPDGTIENNAFTAPSANVSTLKANLPKSNTIGSAVTL